MTDEHHSGRNRRTNSTDYELPPMWGAMSDEKKSAWMTRRRVYRQAIRQDTAFGRRHSRMVAKAKRRESGHDRLD